MTFANRLRQLRDTAGLSEARLAAQSGVSYAAIHEYGLGRRKPSFAAVVKLAKALGTTCEAFADCEDMGGEEKPLKKPPKAPPGVPPADDLEAAAKDEKERKRGADAPPPAPKAPKKGDRPPAAPKDFERKRKGK